MKQWTRKTKFIAGIAVIFIIVLSCIYGMNRPVILINKKIDHLCSSLGVDEEAVKEIDILYNNLTEKQKEKIERYDVVIYAKEYLAEKEQKEQAQKKAEEAELQMLKKINQAINNCSLKNAYRSIVACRDDYGLIINVETQFYVYNVIKRAPSVKASYASDISTIFDAAISVASDYNKASQFVLIVSDPSESTIAGIWDSKNVEFVCDEYVD